jgi:hypothetical protein
MSNKLIAEFMELETKTFKSGILNYYYQDTFEGNWFEEGELSYNLSWDWLMPVVGKINRDEKYYTFENEFRENLLDIVPYGHIEDVYDAVVLFIKNFKTIQDEL